MKEQVTGYYAERFAQRGYVALSFDHRNWGESEGAPRQHEDATAKVADLRSAVGFLAAHPAVDPDKIAVWPAVNPEGMPAGNPGPEPFEYYGTDRGARPGWENRCTALSVLQELTLDVDAYLPLLTAPLLIVHGRGDQAIPVTDAQNAFAAAPEPKELVLLETGNHIDLYDDDTYVVPAIERAISFFARSMD